MVTKSSVSWTINSTVWITLTQHEVFFQVFREGNKAVKGGCRSVMVLVPFWPSPLAHHLTAGSSPLSVWNAGRGNKSPRSLYCVQTLHMAICLISFFMVHVLLLSSSLDSVLHIFISEALMPPPTPHPLRSVYSSQSAKLHSDWLMESTG